MYLILWDQNHQASRTRLSSTWWKVDACPMTYFNIHPAAAGCVAAWLRLFTWR